MSKKPSIDQMIKVYVQLRTKKQEIERETKEEVSGLVKTMREIEGWLMAKADKEGVRSFSTTQGTAYVSSTDYARVQDKEAFLDYVRSNDKFELADMRAAKVAVREHIEEHKEVPPGVNYGTARSVTVNKPAVKA